MTAMRFNPYNWDESSKAIQSGITSLELKNANTTINVSNLDEDILMAIPMFASPKDNTNISGDSEHRFLKPNKMVVHSSYIEMDDIPVTIETAVQEMDIVIEMFVKSGSRPTTNDFDQKLTLSFKQNCYIARERNQTTCVIENSLVSVVPTKPGRLYVGIIGGKNSTQLARKRRSCFGHGRQRRGCLSFKDPPSKGVNKTVFSRYDPSTDVNYTMSITQSSCLYWSEKEDVWTSDGCKVIISQHT